MIRCAVPDWSAATCVRPGRDVVGHRQHDWRFADGCGLICPPSRRAARAARTMAACGGAFTAAHRTAGPRSLIGMGRVTSRRSIMRVEDDVARHRVDTVAVEEPLGIRLDGTPRCRSMVSGRASFELTQKALMAGIPVLAAVSAPSSLAVELAQESGMTLVGFLRGQTMNVYSGGQRVAGVSS